LINRFFLFLFILIFVSTAHAEYRTNIKSINTSAFSVPILLYHRFGFSVTDSMTITIDTFESHLKYLKSNGYKIIPLRQLVDFYIKKNKVPESHSVVIVVDDAHKSVFSHMLPVVKKYNIPVTLFVYPSAISNASYAMTWEQLRELKKTGLFDIQSHTYWHPNFNKEKKKMSPSDYNKFIDMQMKKSKDKLEKELGIYVDMLAWPFGIYNNELEAKAKQHGYIAAFTIERRHAKPYDNPMSLPRYLLNNSIKGKTFERLINNE
jgi:peptidoglycan/xylan/chitin deacetylase (PgdA/CDA1 family)